MIFEKYQKWKKHFYFKNKYCSSKRLLFYKIAYKYLPTDEKAVIVDIGAGKGDFITEFNLCNKYKQVYLLDNNQTTVDYLKKITTNSYKYKAPEKLTFNDYSVDFIHCSHLIEHLYPHELYKFLQEMNRVLKPGGFIVISTPLLWPRFYEDLSHIRPYYPEVIINYLCLQQLRAGAGAEFVSNKYKVKELVFRYYVPNLEEGWGSKYFFVDVLLKIIKTFFNHLGFRKYLKNGYTIVLKKE